MSGMMGGMGLPGLLLLGVLVLVAAAAIKYLSSTGGPTDARVVTSGLEDDVLTEPVFQRN